MKQVLFFAIKDDLLPVFQAVEKEHALKYVRMGQVTAADTDVYMNGADIPNLGRASADSAISCQSFLVAERSLAIRSRGIAGGSRFSIDQLANPDTVSLTPAGLWNAQVLLHGRVATVSESDKAQELMKLFHSAMKKRFAKVKAYFVGPEAAALLEAGKRLTISAQSPHNFDLTVDR